MTIEKRLEALRREWEERQSFEALRAAFDWCGLNDVPLPLWLYQAINHELDFIYENKRDGRHGRTLAARDSSAYKHGTRFNLVKAMLDLQQMECEVGVRVKEPSIREAAEEAGRILREKNDEARGSTDSIIESYKLLLSGGK